MSNLTETVKTRVSPELREQLEREAERRMISPAALLRIYLSDGLVADRARGDHSRRA